MKISYESTIDEAVEANYRLAEMVGAVRRMMWIGLAFSPVPLVVSFILFEHLAAKLIVGGVAMAVLVLFHLLTYKRNCRRGIRKTLVKARGTDQPIPTEFELDEECLIFRQLGTEVRFSWQNVKNVTETPRSIELVMEPTGIAMIPKRVFDNPETIREWLRFITQHAGRSGPATDAGPPLVS